MKINCLHCGHSFGVDDSYCDYEGFLKCPTCSGLLEARIEDGMIRSVRPGSFSNPPAPAAPAPAPAPMAAPAPAPAAFQAPAPVAAAPAPIAPAPAPAPVLTPAPVQAAPAAPTRSLSNNPAPQPKQKDSENTGSAAA